MNNDQTSLLQAALERAAATMRGPSANDYVAQNFGNMQAPSATPNEAVANRSLAPAGGLPSWLTGANFAPLGQSQGFAPSDPNRGNMTVPMPMARPQAAPQPTQAPQQAMGFFQRNAMMQHDPVTGALLDPSQGAAQATTSAGAPVQANSFGGGGFQPREGSILGKIMALGNDNYTGTGRNGAINNAVGPTSVGGAPLQASNASPIAQLFGLMKG